MSDKRGITVLEIPHVRQESVERFYSDDEILEIFPDGDGSMVNALLRRAQAAEAIIDRLVEELAELADVEHLRQSFAAQRTIIDRLQAELAYARADRDGWSDLYRKVREAVEAKGGEPC